MNAGSDSIFEEFRKGLRPLFIARKKGVLLAEASWLDLGVQKWNGGIRLMFWKNAAHAESSLIEAGVVASFEIHSITPDELRLIARRIWGPEAEQAFPYFICEE